MLFFFSVGFLGEVFSGHCRFLQSTTVGASKTLQNYPCQLSQLEESQEGIENNKNIKDIKELTQVADQT